MKNNKIIFIVPYYGKFPSYFREWTYTAGFLAKQNIDFLLITDIDIDFDLPSNIYLKKMSFEEFRKKTQKKFDFKIALDSPYKLCDFKCTFGYLFEEEISKYGFWGNCDIDQVWGDVRNFITDDILEKYERIQYLGHFILYKNCPKMNEAFKLPGAIYNYKKVLSSSIHYSFCEHSGMMKIIEKNNIHNYIKNNYADISPKFTRTYISRVKNYKYQILYWENGHVYRKYIDENNEIGTEEYMYFHFQRKKPESLKCWQDNNNPKRFLYNYRAFKLLDLDSVDIKYIKKYSDYVSKKNDVIERKKYIKSKIKKFFTIPYKQKIIWIKQKVAARKVLKNKKYFIGEN